MNENISALRYSLITALLVYLILFPTSCVYATELKTSPAGIDVWSDGKYLGKTPLQIEADPESTIYLFTFATTDGIMPYRILRLDPTVIQSENGPYDLYPLIAPNLFYDKYGLGKMTVQIGHGTLPYIFLNNDVGQSYGISTWCWSFPFPTRRRGRRSSASSSGRNPWPRTSIWGTWPAAPRGPAERTSPSSAVRRRPRPSRPF